ncbi:MAG: molybdopterin synthase catalytic subunit MoaE [Pseudomonadota bacterium]
MDTTIRVQHADFSLQEETNFLRAHSNNVGAVVTFSGLVRDQQDGNEIKALFLEHYPGMTEKSLRDIAEQAGQRWPLLGVTIIHRIGELAPGDQIVFVGVTSAHRGAAFAACEFMMDYLKTRAPFWKKCLQEGNEHWVESKDTDHEASKRW